MQGQNEKSFNSSGLLCVAFCCQVTATLSSDMVVHIEQRRVSVVLFMCEDKRFCLCACVL